jgi:cyclopropane fatty-acyl-phospholipid synthase-like methyltransferase
MEIKDIYTEGEYLTRNESWHTEDSPWKADHIMRIMEKNTIRPSTVCEIGCGAGEILNQLQAKLPAGIKYYGYEISPQAFEKALPRAKQGLTFLLKDMLEEDVFYDVALIIDVIEHVPDFYSFLQKVKTKATYKIFHIPLDLSVQTVWRSKPILAGRKQVGHIHYFTKETALAALGDMGYTIIDHFYTAGMVEIPGKSFQTKLLNWPRRLLFGMNQDFAARLLGGYSLMVLAK